jgi:hypothetical protein
VNEEQIAMHQFLGYILNHVPEYRPFYMEQIAVGEPEPDEMARGVAGFLIRAWSQRSDQGLTGRADTFSRMVEAIEMGIRAQADDTVGLIITELREQINQSGREDEIHGLLGPCTRECLAEAGD